MTSLSCSTVLFPYHWPLSCSQNELFVTDLLEQLLSFVARGMGDPSARVRLASCFALSELAEHCQPEISRHHAALLPPILAGARDGNTEVRIAVTSEIRIQNQNMRNVNKKRRCVAITCADAGTQTFVCASCLFFKVCERCCFALESFVDNMESEVVPYIGSIYEVLEHLTTLGDDAHQSAISCMGALATAAQDHFTPLVDPVAHHLKTLMGLRDIERLPLLCQAIGEREKSEGRRTWIVGDLAWCRCPSC